MNRNFFPRPRVRIAGGIAVGLAALTVGIVVVLRVLPGTASADASTPAIPAAGQSTGIFTASGIEVTDGATLPALHFSPITVRVASSNISQVKCVLDGLYLGTDDTAPYNFDAAPPSSGDHKLRCTHQDDADNDSVIRVSFAVGTKSRPTMSSVDQATSSNPLAPTISAVPTDPVTSADSSGKEVVVNDAVSLQKALVGAGPGTTITLEDGTYNGKDVKDPSGQEPGRFVATTSGTAAAPIVLRGSRQAVLNGGGTGGGYALHLTGANHWRLQGFTVESASKGIVLDNSNHTVIDDVHVTNIGDEGIHFRSFSSDNMLSNSVVDNTGVNSPNYGEGVYIGSAQSNWGKHSGGQPDRSDRNQIVNNRITDTAAENLDIKEGSSDGVVRGNYLGGDKVASKNSADSWIDVKGNGYVIESNHGVTAPRPNTTECGDPKGDLNSGRNPFCEGFQVHVILNGWGQNNTFTSNTLEVNAPGAGIWLQNTAVPLNNIIKCNNKVTGAAAGDYATNHYSKLPCTP